MSLWFTLSEDGARLMLRITPNAKHNSIEGVRRRADGTSTLAVKVTAPPDKGKVNEAVIASLSKALGLPKSAFAIASGHTARTKTITVNADPGPLAKALERLAN